MCTPVVCAGQSRLDDREEQAVVAIRNLGDGIHIRSHIAEYIGNGRAGSRTEDIIAAIVETSAYLVGGLFLAVGEVQERVDIECILLASHIGEGGGAVGFGGRTPYKEVAELVGQEVEVEAVVQYLIPHVRLVVSQVAAHAETLVETLFAVALVGEEVDTACHVEVADAAGVREVQPFVQRIAYAVEDAAAQDRFYRILALLPERLIAPTVSLLCRIAVDADVGSDMCFRGQSRTCSADVDHAVQCRRAVQYGRGSFDDFHLLYILCVQFA